MTDSCAPTRTTNGNCYVYPDCPAVAAVPTHNEVRASIGWNAGANSIDALSTNLQTVFTMPDVTGVVIGLRGEREHQTLPDFIGHGFYFRSLLGTMLVSVMESGVEQTLAVVRALDDVFEIRRVGTRITYWHNHGLVRISSVRSNGTKVVTACMYASGDYIAGDEAPAAAPVNAGKAIFSFSATGTGTSVAGNDPVGDGTTYDGGELTDGQGVGCTLSRTDYYQFSVFIPAGTMSVEVDASGDDGQYTMWIDTVPYDTDADAQGSIYYVQSDSSSNPPAWTAGVTGEPSPNFDFTGSTEDATWYVGLYAVVGSTFASITATLTPV